MEQRTLTAYSIVELSVGICITCMPATSVLFRHALPHATRLLSKTTSYASKFRSNIPPSLSKGSQEDGGIEKVTNYAKRQYRNLGDRELMLSDNESHILGLYSAQSVKTDVTTGSLGDHSDGKIHLRVDLEQG